MTTFCRSAAGDRRRMARMGAVASLSFIACASLSTGARAASVTATQTTSAVPRALAAEARRNNAADQSLVAKAKAAERCLVKNRSHASRCRTAEGSLQRAGVQLAAARRGLAKVAAQTAHPASSSKPPSRNIPAIFIRSRRWSPR